MRELDAPAEHASPDPNAGPCFICLEGGSVARHCACPRLTHRHCLARWQLQRSGTSEETNCRFCQQKLPDWKEALFPDLSPRAAPSRPTMAIHFGNQRFVMQVSPGVEGVNEFKSKVKKLLGFGPDDEFDVSFSVPVPSFDHTSAARAQPGTGGNLNLNGLHQFEAVTTVAMANRLERQRLRSLPRLASNPPLAHPSQLNAAVAQAAAEAQAAEVAAAAAMERAVATATAADALASGQAAPASLQHQGSWIKRKRDESLTSSYAGSCNSKEEETLMPGLRVGTPAPSFKQGHPLLQSGSQIPADVGNLSQLGHTSSSEAASRPGKCPRTSSTLFV